MSKYVITYYLNSAAAERRPHEKEDLEDWKVEEVEYPLDIEAYEYVFKNILNFTEEDLQELYENLNDPDDDLEKIRVLQSYLDDQDLGSGEPIIISIEGSGQNYDSGLSKEDLLNVPDDEDESSPKQRFIDYCKDKIKDLGYTEVNEDGEIINYPTLMTADEIREFKNVRIIQDDNYPDNLIAVDENGKVVINTPMITSDTFAARLEFTSIDTKFYNNLIEYWDELYMDEIMEEE